MLQIAGLAAILNEINPTFGQKLHDIFDVTSGSVKGKLTEPIMKSYKHGYINGFITGVLTGVILSGAVVAIIWRRSQQTNKN